MFNGTIGSVTQDPNAQSVYSVTSLNLAIKDQLEGSFFYCLVEGEVSNAAFPQSGHIYFNLKDDGAVIKAVIWRSQAMMYRALIGSGQKVRVSGKITVYAPRGEYQLIVSRVEEAGKGDLYLEFEALKKRLEADGLFDGALKKPIPKHPQKIGIITSNTAAALQDVLNVFTTHRPDIPLILYETKVQGAQAGEEIAAAIVKANQEAQVDLLLLVRGGGSIEDLWAFNEEIVARAIFESQIPIITGVGHETDTTIADFVADLRAPTPSMAAKYSSQSRDELYQLLSEFEERLLNLMRIKYEGTQRKLTALLHRLQVKEPKLQMQTFQSELKALQGRLRETLTLKITHTTFQIKSFQVSLDIRLLQAKIEKRQEQLLQLQQRLESSMLYKQKKWEQLVLQQIERLHLLSPLHTLLRGYSMTSNDAGAVIKSISQVSVNDELKVQVADGAIAVKVTDITLL